jgi:hypothetical protein
MMLAYLSGGSRFCLEARGYGLLAGFASLAWIAWHGAFCDSRRKNIWLFVFILFQSLAFYAHPFAAFLYVPLAIAELVRYRKERTLAWDRWLGLLLPPALYAPQVLSFLLLREDLVRNAWNPPTKAAFASAYLFYLRPASFYLLMGMLAVMLKSRLTVSSEDPSRFRTSEAERAALYSTLFTPIWIVAGAFAVGMYAPRYAILLVLLLPLGLGHLLRTALPRERSTPVILFMFLLAGYLVEHRLNPAIGLSFLARSSISTDNLSQSELVAHLRNVNPSTQVVVSPGTFYFELAYAMPEPAKSRLTYLADRDLAIRWIGYDTPELNAILFARHLPLRVLPFKEFLSSGNPFLLLVPPSTKGWQWHELAVRNWQLRFVRSLGGLELFEAVPPKPKFPGGA